MDTDRVALPGWGLVLVTGVAALVIAATGFVSRYAWWRRVVFCAHVLNTIVHEAGHAFLAVVTGGGVYLIEITSPDGGRTFPWHPSWFSSVLSSFAGYAAPPLAGLGVAALLGDGKARPALILTVVAMVLVLVVSRDALTIVCVATVGFVAFAAAYWGSTGLQQWVAYTEAWLLLLCELAGVWTLVRNRLRGHSGGDADDLAQETHIPGPVWILAWLALNGWALWVAVPLLWP
jgi:peptidase M50B-like protein